MNLRTHALCVAALLGMGAIGCRKDPNDSYQPQPPAPVPVANVTPGNEAILLPLDVGNQWTYTAQVSAMVGGKQQPTQNFEVTWKIVKTQKSADGTDAFVEITRNGAVNDRQQWRVNSKGAFQISDGLKSANYQPPMPMITFPVQANGTFKWQGTGPTPFNLVAPHKSSSLVRAPQEVDTDLGRFSAYPVESDTRVTVKGKPARSVSTVWFAPNIGIVRFRQEAVAGDTGAVVLLKLKSKSLMKS